MDPALTAAAGPGLAALLGGLNADQRRAVTHEGGPLLVVAGAGTGKTEVITRRIAWLVATRRARPSEVLALTFTDKAAEEMALRVDQLVPVRLHGHGDLHVPCLRRRAHPRVRPRAGPADRRPRAVATRGRDLPARAPLRVRPRPLPTPRRPDPVPVGPRHVVQPLQGRGHRPGRLPRLRDDGARPRPRPWRRPPGSTTDEAAAAATRLPGARTSSPAPTARYQRLLAAERVHRLRRPGVARAPAPPHVTRGPRRSRRPVPLHRGGRVPGHEPGPGRAGRAAGRGASQRRGRRRRRPGHLCLPRRGHRQHPRVPRPLPVGTDRGPAPELPIARARARAPHTD